MDGPPRIILCRRKELAYMACMADVALHGWSGRCPGPGQWEGDVAAGSILVGPHSAPTCSVCPIMAGLAASTPPTPAACCCSNTVHAHMTCIYCILWLCATHNCKKEEKGCVSACVQQVFTDLSPAPARGDFTGSTD